MVVTMFSTAELACASSTGSVLMSMAWLGISPAACFSSARAARAEMPARSTACVSRMSPEGMGGRSL